MKKYNIIYADPPWKFNNKNTGGSMKSGSANQYDVMTLQDICNLPINKIAADDCTLFMWWVASMPEEAIEVVRNWGFTIKKKGVIRANIKTMTGFNWVKTTKLGKLFFGMGFWTRQGSENMLIAVKGKPKRINAGIRSVIIHKALRHSEKPGVFADAIVKLMGNLPRIELFARTTRPGWDSWGNQVECDIDLLEAA